MNEKTAGRTLPLLVYFLIATPLESLASLPVIHRLMYGDWLVLLDLGPFVQAIIVLSFLLTLRSLLARGKEESAGAQTFAHRGPFIALGIAVGLLTSWAWWQLFRLATQASGQQEYIFGRRPFSPTYYPGTLGSGVGFGLAFTVFIAFYLGIAGGELAARWSPKRRLFAWGLPRSNGSELAWDLWISWLVLYRLSLMFFFSLVILFGGSSGEGGWDGMLLLAAPYLATAVVCIPFSKWLARRAPATRKSAIGGSLGASFLISLLSGIMLLPFGWLGIAVIASAIVYLNAPGIAWGWIAGELRWRSFQLTEPNAVDE